MYAFLLAATVSTTPVLPAADELAPLFREQQDIAMQDIRIQIQADLEQRGARFFAENGELRRMLDRVLIAETGLAAR